MTMPRREVSKILASCLQDETQAAKLEQWSERTDPEEPGLDNASAALLFAAAMGDADSWQNLVALHPELAGLDRSDMTAVLEQLFA